MLKKTIIIAILLCTLFTGIFAQTKGLGVGIMLGEPTGVGVKFWLDKISALDLGLAWSFLEPVSFRIHGDYLAHFLNPFPEPLNNLFFYAGLGIRVNISTLPEMIALGIRIPLGIGYFINALPLDIFLEIAPGLNLLLETASTIGFLFGVRYFFTV